MLSVQHKTVRGASIVWLLLAFGMVVDNADGKAKRMVRTEAEPQYVRNENYPAKWFRVLKKGIDTTRDYLGNYGPLCVYIIGQEQDELKSDKIAKKIVDAYCRNRHGEASDRLSDCLKRKGVSLIERARDGSTEAYLSYVDFLDKPLSELVFINPHGFPMPYLHTRGIHEYTHVFQRAFPRTPTWLTEGGAEFLAYYLGDKHKWINFEKSMKDSMRKAKSVENGEASLIDFEDVRKIEKERPHLRKYYRHLAYDAGAWAVVLLIHHSESRSVKRFTTRFYSMLKEQGWRSAVCLYGGYEDIDTFYEAFGKFLDQAESEQMKMLREIKP